jgi:hypothetical protein
MRFHTDCGTLKVLALGDYIFTLNKMELGIRELRNHDYGQKLLISTTVHKVRRNELNQRHRRKIGGHQYKLLTTMMRFNTELDRIGHSGQISSLDGRFIYFRHVGVHALREENNFHSLLENFIIKAYEMKRDFDQIESNFTESDSKRVTFRKSSRQIWIDQVGYDHDKMMRVAEKIKETLSINIAETQIPIKKFETLAEFLMIMAKTNDAKKLKHWIKIVDAFCEILKVYLKITLLD